MRDELSYLMADRIKSNRKVQEQDISIQEIGRGQVTCSKNWGSEVNLTNLIPEFSSKENDMGRHEGGGNICEDKRSHMRSN